jgi:hypothetical protein
MIEIPFFRSQQCARPKTTGLLVTPKSGVIVDGAFGAIVDPA